MEKLYVSADELLEASYQLAWRIYESGFRPDFIIAIWRGGTPVGIAVQEFFDLMGVQSDHISIRTSSYTGIGERQKTVQVYGLNYIIRQVESDNSLLMIDDVFDTGLSIQKVINDLESACKKNTPNIRVATPYYKPENNLTERTPDYFLYETSKWIVFPHELKGLSLEEIKSNKPMLSGLIDKISPQFTGSS
jgi:hypothetical protein|tara:strand:+ start:137 stop:712 length:576 start_codon:yes stop_codon:yes gene_type:complete